MEPEIKQALSDLGSAFEAFKSTNDERLSQIEKRGSADAITEEKLSKIDGVIDKLEDRIGKVEAKSARPLLGGPGGGDPEAEVKAFNTDLVSQQKRLGRPIATVDADGMAQYKAAFDGFLRKDTSHLSDSERKAMSVGSDPDGGYLVPADMTGRIVAKIYETSPIRQISAVQAISTDALEGITDNGEVGIGWVAETAARPSTTTPQLGKWRIEPHEWYAMPEATQKLLEDSAVDLAGWLESKIAERSVRLEGSAFVVGDGVGKPRGFTTYPTAATADGARAWGTLEHLNTAQNGDFASANPADVLIDVIEAMKDGYRDGCTWITRRSVISKIRKFKESTTNAYLWQPGLQQGQPPTLLGFPVIKSEDMPALNTGSLSMAFGNFRLSYQIVDRKGMTVLRDPYSNKPYVQFYTVGRVGGDVVHFEALKFVRFGS